MHAIVANKLLEQTWKNDRCPPKIGNFNGIVVPFPYIENLTPIEHQALNKSLQFWILSTKFDFINVQTKLENTYRQVRPRLQNTKRLLFKTVVPNRRSA